MNEASEMVNRQNPLSFHKCQSCAFRTNSQHVILSHLENHRLKSECKGFSCKSANLEVYKCQSCSLESDLKVAVCGHKILVHGKTHCSDPEIELRSYICDKCDFETYSLLVFARHVCDDSQSEELSKSKSKYLLNEHICVYTPPEIWLQCVKCSYKTKKKTHLKSHIVKTHFGPNEINWFECEQCAYKTRRMIHLKGHILRKHMDPDEGESSCQSKYTVELDDINIHDELTDDGNIKEIQSPTDTTPAQSLRKNFKSVTNKTNQNLTSRGFNVPSSNRGTKKYFCIFCKHLTAKLPRHLEIMHKEEPEVQEISCLRKGSLERKNLIEKIRKKGIFEYNCSEDYNTERELIVSRRPQSNKGRIDRHYECCSNCHGFFSKLTLRKHFRKCAQSSKKGERNIMITGRRARQIINNNIASNELKNEVLPVLRDDAITDAIRTDKLLLLFGNKMLKNNHAKYHHKMIRAHLRCLGRFLVAVKDKCTEINEFAGVYNVKYYDIIISTINEVAGLNYTNGKYKVPSYALMVSMLLKKVGNLLITECVKQKNYILKMIVKDFLKLFSTDYCKSVSKTVKENQLEIKRHKETEQPTLKILSSKENQKNYNFESEFSQKDPFVKIVKHFNSEHNVNMESETTLIQNSLHTLYQPEDNLEFDYNIVIVELEVDSQGDTTITGELEEFNSGSLTSIDMRTPKGKKGKNKVAWSTHETKLLQERFAQYIKMRKLPPREECEQLINEHPFLKCRGRTVPKIKAWVSNYFRRLRLVKSNEM